MIPAMRPASRIPSLDGLRAFSILSVLWAHSAGTRGFPVRFSLDSILGVRIFFVISGFIITTLLLKEERDSGTISLAGFYQRRAARILPALWLYLAVVSLLGLWNVFPFHFDSDLLQPITFTMGFFHRTPAWEIRHTWSLSIEEQFYLVWPMILVCSPGLKRLRLIFIGLLVLAGPVLRCWIYQHPKSEVLNWMIVGHVDVLAWGCLVAILRMDFPCAVQRIINWRPAIARVLALLVIQFAPWYWHRAMVRKFPPLSTNALSISFQAGAIAFLILSLTERRRGFLYGLLNLKAVSALGTISYGLYLWQQLFLADSDRWWNHWPVNLVFSLLAAMACYFLVEEPIRAMAHRSRLSGRQNNDFAGHNA
jgi:peptidoglycan/LPS O-acetylase OafA/YrhL